MTLSTTLKTNLRAGVVALALAGTAIGGIAPVQAAPASPQFGFSLNFGNGNFTGPKGGVQLNFGDRDYFKFCLSNTQIRNGLRAKGYRNVDIVRESHRWNQVWVVAQKRGDWYSMRVNRCTGKVDQVREVNRNRNGSFNLSFTFGN